MNDAPSTDELTIAEAAELLKVSLVFLSGLIEAKEFRVRGHGAARRLVTADVLDHRDRADARADRALDEMTADAEAAGLYDARGSPRPTTERSPDRRRGPRASSTSRCQPP